MTRILFVGQEPETVDFSDPALPPGFSAEKFTPGLRLPCGKRRNADGTPIFAWYGPTKALSLSLKVNLQASRMIAL